MPITCRKSLFQVAVFHVTCRKEFSTWPFSPSDSIPITPISATPISIPTTPIPSAAPAARSLEYTPAKQILAAGGHASR